MPNEIVTRAIDAVASGTHLTADHASAVLDEIMEGRASEVQTGAFLVALRAKGETVAELVGLARTMRRLAAPVDVDRHDLVDTAGTGGGPLTFNISTTAALVAAGAGCAVGRASTRSGWRDALASSRSRTGAPRSGSWSRRAWGSRWPTRTRSRAARPMRTRPPSRGSSRAKTALPVTWSS